MKCAKGDFKAKSGGFFFPDAAGSHPIIEKAWNFADGLVIDFLISLRSSRVDFPHVGTCRIPLEYSSPKAVCFVIELSMLILLAEFSTRNVVVVLTVTNGKGRARTVVHTTCYPSDLSTHIQFSDPGSGTTLI